MALRAARAGASVLRETGLPRPVGAAELKGRGDYVTAADRHSEAAIVEVLAREAPGVAVLAEEAGGVRASTMWAVDPLDGMVRAEARAELRAGLRQLKPLDRATLEAFYLRGESLKAMARAFGTPVGTIKRRLHVARQRLKEALEETAPRARHRRELACV